VPKLDTNATREYIVLDFAGLIRFTHHPSGDTCLRHSYMHGGDTTLEWQDKFRAFRDRHPNAHVVVNDHREIVDDLRDYPIFGGGFNVGDLVVTRQRGMGETDAAREIVGIRENGSAAYREPGELEYSFILEDGNFLYWNSLADGWQTRDRGNAETSRARRVVEGDNLERLRIPSDEMLLGALKKVAEPLEWMNNTYALYNALKDEPETYAAVTEELRDILQMMPAMTGGLNLMVQTQQHYGRLDPETVPIVTAPAAELLVRVANLAERLMKYQSLRASSENITMTRLDEVLRRADTVAETMRRRGVLPEVDASASLAL